MALGRLLKLDPVTGNVLGALDVGPRPRGVAVSHDGREVYVTRFISPDTGGEVVKVDVAGWSVLTKIVLRLDAETVDSDQKARGLPNYLFAIALTPDGRQGWIPGKKDNILRGAQRDGLEVTHDTLVRPFAAVIDPQGAREIFDNRVDLDDRSMPVHVEFSTYGNFAILTLAGSNRLEVRDVNQPTHVFSAISEVGSFPRATVLAPNGHLFVQSVFSRSVLVYDMESLLEKFEQTTPPRIAEIPAVSVDQVPARVLEGKKLFNNAEDTRLGFEGYIACGVCHFEGMDDGQVYDFSSLGEGLRNTIALQGTGQGPMNWTGNIDEVQDFEHQIRELFDGLGFIADDVYSSGTYALPFGTPKAGLSQELDAIDAYVRSLNSHVNPSPYRNPDGSLTPDAIEGQALFLKLGCDFCHVGPDFTDSERQRRHDVGTTVAASGQRLGEPLYGLDTPTLLGVWETPPYLHDGSAATLRDVLTLRNPTDMHGFTSTLASEQLDQLVAYLLQIDGEQPVRRLPFEPELPPAPTPLEPVAPAPTGPASTDPPDPGTSSDAPPASQKSDSVLACRMHPTSHSNNPLRLHLGLVVGLLAAFGLSRRCSGHTRSSKVGLGVFAVGMLAWVATLGCSPQGSEEPPATGPRDWSELPPAFGGEPELASLGSRETTLARVCARGRRDSFATALCDAGERPALRNIQDVLALAELADNSAFALTGNSTSVVAKHVSAINPRMIVFPRVGADLKRTDRATSVGFVRGEQFLEIASRDLATEDINFYLLAFEQECNYSATGCDLASLLTDEIERNWTAYSVYDHEDLENTSLDCLSCHQMGPPGTQRILRMQELQGPWLHWFPQRFSQRTESDRVLTAQFAEAHAYDEQYGGIPISTIVNAIDEGSGAQLEAFVRAEGSGQQPNLFDGHIVAEVASGTSPTWEARFKAHLRGEAIAVPYPFVDVTDENKRVAASRSYVDVVTGVAAREALVDIREVFTLDAAEKLSFVPPPGASGETVLRQMCARCHDGRGNPALPKNRFNVLDLDAMSRELRELAIVRVNAQDATVMPPARMGRLTPEAIEAAIQELRK